MILANSTLRASLAIYHLISACEMIVNYVTIINYIIISYKGKSNASHPEMA